MKKLIYFVTIILFLNQEERELNSMNTPENNKFNEIELLKLDNQLCFALYVCSKEIIKKYKPLLEPLGLTYTSYITLLALWEEDNINVKDLGNKLYLDSGTLTPILKKLELANLVKRTRSCTDERNVFLSLTKEGQDLKEKALSVPKELVCSLNVTNDKGSKDININNINKNNNNNKNDNNSNNNNNDNSNVNSNLDNNVPKSESFNQNIINYSDLLFNLHHLMKILTEK